MQNVATIVAADGVRAHDIEPPDSQQGILAPSSRRFVLFPIAYVTIWSLYKTALHGFFTAEQVVPYSPLEKMGSEQICCGEVHTVLLLLTSGDKCPAWATISTSIQSSEARSFLGFASASDNILYEAYALLLQALFPGTHPCLLASQERRSLWLSSALLPAPCSFGRYIVSFTIASYLFYCATSCSISLLSPCSPLIGAGGLFTRAELAATQRLSFARLILLELDDPPQDAATRESIDLAAGSEVLFWCSLWRGHPDIAEAAVNKITACAALAKAALTGLPTHRMGVPYHARESLHRALLLSDSF